MATEPQKNIPDQQPPGFGQPVPPGAMAAGTPANPAPIAPSGFNTRTDYDYDRAYRPTDRDTPERDARPSGGKT